LENKSQTRPKFETKSKHNQTSNQTKVQKLFKLNQIFKTILGLVSAPVKMDGTLEINNEVNVTKTIM
jgi:hypothetical protein